MIRMQFITSLMTIFIAIIIVNEFGLGNNFWGLLIILISGLPLIILGLSLNIKKIKKYDENDKDWILIKKGDKK